MKHKILQFIKTPIPNNYQTCINNLKSKITNKVDYELMTSLPFKIEDKLDYRIGADYGRIKLGTIYSNMIWIDADTEKGDKDFFIPPNDGRPYFAFVERFNHIIYDPYCFYVNGNTSFFEKLLMRYDNDKNLHVLGWIQSLLQEYKNEIGIIPEGHFNHKDLFYTTI